MRTSRKTAVVGTTVVTLLGAGVAFAAWTSTGTGSADVAAGSAKDLSVSAVNMSGLVPSGSKTVDVTVSNPNSYRVQLDSITVDSITVAGNPACTVALSAVSAASLSGLSDVIAPTGSATQQLVVSMGADSANACQGAVFTVHTTASAHSVA